MFKVTVEEVLPTDTSYTRERVIYTQYVDKLALSKLIDIVNEESVILEKKEEVVK